MKCSYCGCRESEAGGDFHHVVTSGTHFKQGESLHLCPDCYAQYRQVNPDRSRNGLIGMALVGGFIFVAMASRLLFGY